MLEIYIGSVIGSIALELGSFLDIMVKIKKNGYAFNRSNDTFIETLLFYLKFILFNCIPVLNVVAGLSVLVCDLNESLLEEIQLSMLEKGVIHKTEELLAKEEEEKIASINHEQVRADLDTLDYSDNNRYSNMSDAEKLAFLKKERELILGAGKIEEPFQKVKKTRKNKNI